MNKAELVGTFRTAINNCKLVYASMLLFSHDDMPKIYRQLSDAIDIPRPYDEIEIISLLTDRDVSKIAFSELYDTVHRAALKELFEITKYYCEFTGQLKIIQSQGWYQFWRVLRNCLSHDFKLQFNEYDLKKLPVSWGKLTIDMAMEGKNLTHGNFSRQDIVAFLTEVSDFIEKELA